MPKLKIKLEFDVEIEEVNESEDGGLSDEDIKHEFKHLRYGIEKAIERLYNTATVESDLTVKLDE